MAPKLFRRMTRANHTCKFPASPSSSMISDHHLGANHTCKSPASASSSMISDHHLGANHTCKSPASASSSMISDHHLGTISMSSSSRIDRSASQLIDSRRMEVFTGLSETPRELEAGYSSSDDPTGIFSTESSSRCLLNNDSSDDEIGPIHAPVRIEFSRFHAPKVDNSSTVFIPASPEKQAVALRVSLHCKACEGKVRKHISKMEGVTSYSVDLATKKVMVVGDVTPLGVLNSISKVKNAQFWPSLSAAGRVSN